MLVRLPLTMPFLICQPGSQQSDEGLWSMLPGTLAQGVDPSMGVAELCVLGHRHFLTGLQSLALGPYNLEQPPGDRWHMRAGCCLSWGYCHIVPVGQVPLKMYLRWSLGITISNLLTPCPVPFLPPFLSWTQTYTIPSFTSLLFQEPGITAVTK